MDHAARSASLPDKVKLAALRHPATPRLSRQWRIGILQVLLLICLLVSWQFASGRLINPILISSPSDVARVLWIWVNDGTLLHHARFTLQATVLGFLLGCSLGLVIGYVTGWYRIIGDVTRPFMTALYTTPRLALAPLFMLWFGLGMEFRVIFASVIVLFLIYYNTFYGVRDVHPDLIAAVRVMGASRLDILRRVVAPSALVWVTAGLKLSVPYAFVGVVVAEILAANEGLGYLVASGAAQFAPARTFAAIVVLMVLAIIIDQVVQAVTDRALRWRKAGDGGRQ